MKKKWNGTLCVLKLHEFLVILRLTVTYFVQKRRQEGIQGLVLNSKEDILGVRESLQVFPAKYQEKNEKFNNFEKEKQFAWRSRFRLLCDSDGDNLHSHLPQRISSNEGPLSRSRIPMSIADHYHELRSLSPSMRFHLPPCRFHAGTAIGSWE